MVVSINKDYFIKVMQENEYNPFSYNALSCLYDMIEDIEWQQETSIELDPVAFRSQYVEYHTFADIYKDYSSSLVIDDEDLDGLSFDEKEEKIKESLEYAGAYFCEFDGGIILDVESF